ncbi:protein YceG like [Vibrio ponticus]|nr:protein YceG like [Vibrio ponticus]
MIKKITLLLVLVAAMAAGAFFYLTKQVEQFVTQPLQLTQEQIFTVKPGTSFQGVLAQLNEQKLITSSEVVKVIRHFHPELTQLRAGTYLITPQMNLTEALELFKTGKEHQFSITFVEGSRFSEWRTILENAPYLEHKTSEMSEEEIAKALGLTHTKLEGLFLAETFNYTYGTSDLDILKRSADKLQSVLDEAWQNRQDKLPLKTPYDALILALLLKKRRRWNLNVSEWHRYLLTVLTSACVCKLIQPLSMAWATTTMAIFARKTSVRQHLTIPMSFLVCHQHRLRWRAKPRLKRH